MKCSKCGKESEYAVCDECLAKPIRGKPAEKKTVNENKNHGSLRKNINA